MMQCWICGSQAATGEHLVKASDLKSLFGDPSQADPLYFHTSAIKNFKIGSLKAKVLKSPALICKRCNSATTQPHDRAWQRLSEALRSSQPPIAAGDILRPNRIFPYDTAREMRNVHLYFLKLFGCRIIDGSVPIDTADFGNAILQRRSHPNVYLAFGPTPDLLLDKDRVAGMSEIQGAELDGRCAFATWFYHVGHLAVNIMYAIEGETRYGLKQAWHPRFGHKRLVMATFMSDVPDAGIADG